MDLAIGFLTALGLGHFWSRLTRKDLRDDASLGLTLLLGIALLTWGVYLLSVAGFTLSASARVVAALSLPGLVLFARDRRERELLHPTPLLSLLGVGAVALFTPGYLPHEWDEFSHWVLMPKQMLLADALVSNRFAFHEFMTYTPGWPILVAFPRAVLSSGFDATQLLAMPILFSSALLGWIYDLLGRGATWVCSLLLARLMIAPYYPQSLLIEGPLVVTMTAIFLLPLWMATEKPGPKRAMATLALLPGFGYLLKDSMASLAVPALALSWLMTRRRPRDFLEDLPGLGGATCARGGELESHSP
jgi:hypothetical protein